jgi:hypothetical protein
MSNLPFLETASYCCGDPKRIKDLPSWRTKVYFTRPAPPHGMMYSRSSDLPPGRVTVSALTLLGRVPIDLPCPLTAYAMNYALLSHFTGRAV